jgi:DHA2 family multidrug resistance protein-like MFS transporter
LTPVTDVVLESVPPERTGTASALNSAAIQVGGALGAAILTSVFLDAARTAYFARLAPTGLASEAIREITRAWRKAVAESTSTGARMLLPRGLEGQFEEAYRQAFAVGVARVFLVAALLALACAALAWAAVPARTARARGEPG